MSLAGQKRKRGSGHPYRSGNYAPARTTHPRTPCTFSGTIPEELAGGQYVRNGGNTIMNEELGQDYHWFDGDGMLAGVSFPKAEHGAIQPEFVSQYILTDLYLAAASSPNIRSHIVPSISTLVNPAVSFLRVCAVVMRTLFLVFLSCLPGSRHQIKRISVANTGFYYHDGRALATCESGPPIRVQLPDFETVGWFDGDKAEGEGQTSRTDAVFGGRGPLGWIGEWTTGHPKVDPTTGELVLFHNTFMAPYTKYSVVPAEAPEFEKYNISSTHKLMNAPVPGVSGARMMHDFGVSAKNTVIMDLPLTLDPLNMMRGKPVVAYDSKCPSRFGVFPRHNPAAVRWFETSSCCIFHTANTWDEVDERGNSTAVHFLTCRLTSPSPILVAGNIDPPTGWKEPIQHPSKRLPFFESYDYDAVVVDRVNSETESLVHTSSQDDAFDRSSLLESMSTTTTLLDEVPEEEQCRLYYFRFGLSRTDENITTHQFALSAVPFEFPTVHPMKEMTEARYIYGCSTSTSSFNVALGKAVKIDVLVKADALSLIERSKQMPHLANTGCVDARGVAQVLSDNEKNPNDDIICFKLPKGWYAQEARFVPRKHPKSEDDGYLLFYAFDESQLDADGVAADSAVSELWVLDARGMRDVVCRVHLPQRVPYGFHGSWFTEEQIRRQRAVAEFRKLNTAETGGAWKAVYDFLTGLVG